MGLVGFCDLDLRILLLAVLEKGRCNSPNNVTCNKVTIQSDHNNITNQNLHHTTQPNIDVLFNSMYQYR